jgi:hypothetical protein
LTTFREARRQPHGGDHAPGIGNPPPGDVERGAVIDRRPDDR